MVETSCRRTECSGVKKPRGYTHALATSPGNLAAGSGPPSNNLRPMTGILQTHRSQDFAGTHPPAPAPPRPPSPSLSPTPSQSLPYPHPGSGSLIASPPKSHRRSERPPANSYQPQPSRKAKSQKKKRPATSRAGLFGFVCRLPD